MEQPYRMYIQFPYVNYAVHTYRYEYYMETLDTIAVLIRKDIVYNQDSYFLMVNTKNRTVKICRGILIDNAFPEIGCKNYNYVFPIVTRILLDYMKLPILSPRDFETIIQKIERTIQNPIPGDIAEQIEQELIIREAHRKRQRTLFEW